MPRPEISVVIPCCNAVTTIGETIESALVQEGVAHEVIVVDDGSTDGSASLIEMYKPKVRVMTGPNRGASSARNTGISEASAPWIVFLDADDLLAAGTLASRLDLAEKSKADVIVCDWQDLIVADDESTSAGPVKTVDMKGLGENSEVACATSFWAPPAALMYRRDLVNMIGGFRIELSVVEDAHFLFDAACAGARFAHLPDVGAHYRIREHSLSRRDPEAFAQALSIHAKLIEERWRSRGSLSMQQRDTLFGIYHHAGRGLLNSGNDEFFAAIEGVKRQRKSMPRRLWVGALLARGIGLRRASQIIRYLGA